MASRKLTEKQRAFVEEYLKNGYDIAQAYKSAYNTDKATNAYRTFNSDIVQAEIRRRLSEYWALLDITPEHVLAEIAEVAFAKKGDDFYNANCKLKALELLQKQMGLQSQKIEAELKQNIEINIVE